jgi:hypothetical protein
MMERTRPGEVGARENTLQLWQRLARIGRIVSKCKVLGQLQGNRPGVRPAGGLGSSAGEDMSELFTFFDGPSATMMSSVVAFVAFFLIARVMRARQAVAFAFAFTPLLLFIAVEAAAANLA